MAEYIEREAAEDAVGEAYLKGLNPLWELRDAPAADVALVMHGTWIEKTFLMGTSNFCSLCGCHYGMPHEKYNFCPNCGAKMDGGADND